jgi:hypothetical protein
MPNYPLKNFIEMGLPETARHVIVPEYERRGEILQNLAPLLMNSDITLHEVIEKSGLNFIEFSLDGWEALFNYIRSLEEKAKETESLQAKVHQLIEFIEHSNNAVVKAYREILNARMFS